MEKENKNETAFEEIKEDNIFDKAKETEISDEAEILEDKEFECIEENKENSLEAMVKELKDSNKKLQDENTKLNNEIEALKEKILRITAEYDNYRKRTNKEKESIYTEACEDVLKNILPVLDNLERAATVEGSVEDIKKGIDMVIKQFKDSLDKLNVEEISTDGKFDPNFHNAVMHIEDENYGEKEIVEVFQKGYIRGNKVLRYSMVKVAN
ncbi:molecular chaperone GrpE [Clostridium sp. USBA 49]|uniref:nucleotide exchange factor GrpE n=1 Tax=Clostridium sp. USBA 49 TaxID=1881060 RepID=UPI00099A4B3D|nr:nucleotide exchange factor GrpE [Clostridium sp. USBA 49]SKA75562.1 molecular chaperone GrpE [Clostridium sp. USBA 49]